MNESDSEELMQVEYSDDSEKQNDDDYSAASDDTAVDDFLAELKNYRERLFAKTKTDAKKFGPHIESKSKKSRIRQKRKHHKLFDPKLYGKKVKEEEPITDEQDIKKISRKSLNSMIKRLTENPKDKADKTGGKENSSLSPKGTHSKNDSKAMQARNNSKNSNLDKDPSNFQSNNDTKTLKIFTQLYDQSIESHKKQEEMKRQKEKQEEEEIKNLTQPKTCYQSKVYAHQKVESYVAELFENYTECTEEVLLDILVKLGLIDNNKPETLASLPAIQPILDESRITGEENEKVKYKVAPLRTFYLQVARGQCSTNFHFFAKERLLIVMANKKKPATLDHDPNRQCTSAQLLTKETLDRLVPPKQEQPQVEDKPEEKIDRSFAISEESRKILEKSKKNLSTLPINQREIELMKLKQEKIEQMREEFRQQLVKDIVKPNPKPQYDEETNQKLAEYKEKKKNYKPTEPSYRPTLITKPPENKEVEKPNGWDEDIERHKKAQAKSLHLKKLKAGDVNYVFQSRIEARMKKQSQPSSPANSKIKANNTKPKEGTTTVSTNLKDEQPNTINPITETNEAKPNESLQNTTFMDEIHDSDAADAEDDGNSLTSD